MGGRRGGGRDEGLVGKGVLTLAVAEVGSLCTCNHGLHNLAGHQVLFVGGLILAVEGWNLIAHTRHNQGLHNLAGHQHAVCGRTDSGCGC